MDHTLYSEAALTVFTLSLNSHIVLIINVQVSHFIRIISPYNVHHNFN